MEIITANVTLGGKVHTGTGVKGTRPTPICGNRGGAERYQVTNAPVNCDKCLTHDVKVATPLPAPETTTVGDLFPGDQGTHDGATFTVVRRGAGRARVRWTDGTTSMLGYGEQITRA